MKTNFFLILISMLLIVFSCNPTSKKKEESVYENSKTIKDSVLYSFAFVGCNRIQYSDWHNDSATNASTANLSALKRIYNDMIDLKKKPSLFFFLGDLVLAESNTDNLDAQLEAWVKLYEDTSFSNISNSGIELVAVPGNHEMLYYKDYGVKGHDEWPLGGATKIWMKHMKSYMPKDRQHITGKDSLINQMTFSFTRNNVGFVVMNTDTYNPPTKENPYGLEGIIPTQWIINKIKEYRKDSNIDHVFVLGHKPYYVNGKPETGHKGFPEGPILWPELQNSEVIAMLSAHVHDYERMQPEGKGTYQIIAGNAGSDGPAKFFGYSVINILNNGEVQLISRGFDKGKPYYKDVPNNLFKVRDSTILTWAKNKNPYEYN
ncbi:metallophosphoesterase family protein [Aquimarina sp. 2201CG5-10]|uniref:metallophosphoesterase family protein n=1 Tax=Aquimarina callyspongiae TaxID=3098150 RepID=UPI002AB3B34F|nr:metallophosphoesterase [Aquimarina sp. 2201CG5-10]MDY8135799.1 metallophosphoesterase [Aquimarina sp. 2201CG5-10]